MRIFKRSRTIQLKIRLLFLALIIAHSTFGQELELRALTILPVKTNFVLVGLDTPMQVGVSSWMQHYRSRISMER